MNENDVNVNVNDDVNAGVNTETNANVMNEDNMEEPIDTYDPKNWNIIDQKLIDILVEKGPIRVSDFEFPYDNISGKCFLVTYYTKSLTNLEKQDRRWLIYSISLDKVFCFCCKLFKKRENTMQLANDGSMIGIIFVEGFKGMKRVMSTEIVCICGSS
ncbi:zinc finger MYM-type protein 5-like [Papaver somniferum]|uniref:zinc finger MYM-type protein 5-like n=1 Tax=Papaver somniferum TaxID=3469 RepID=UPI000E6FF6F4|nr:zinc finger MYM-type protein 5-like [Papaver somniferum]